jgi:hypothetical protein
VKLRSRLAIDGQCDLPIAWAPVSMEELDQKEISEVEREIQILTEFL